jgi:hypothetical protein
MVTRGRRDKSSSLATTRRGGCVGRGSGKKRGGIIVAGSELCRCRCLSFRPGAVEKGVRAGRKRTGELGSFDGMLLLFDAVRGDSDPNRGLRVVFGHVFKVLDQERSGGRRLPGRGHDGRLLSLLGGDRWRGRV